MGACRSRAAEAAEPVSIDPGPPPPAKRPVVPRNVTVVVIGLDNAGKTTIVNNLIGEPDNFVMPTMGFDLDTLQRRQFAVRIFGLGGAHSIRGYWDNYFDEVHGILFVVDSADAARLDLVGQVFGEVMGQQRVSGKPILVFANKQDLSGALSSAEIAQRLRLPEYKASPVHIQASVALVEPESTDERRRTPDPSIPTAFDWLLDAIDENWDALAERIARDVAVRREAEAEKLRQAKERVAAQRKLDEAEEAKRRAEEEAKEAEEAAAADRAAAEAAPAPAPAADAAANKSEASSVEAEGGDEAAARPTPERARDYVASAEEAGQSGGERESPSTPASPLPQPPAMQPLAPEAEAEALRNIAALTASPRAAAGSIEPRGGEAEAEAEAEAKALGSREEVEVMAAREERDGGREHPSDAAPPLEEQQQQLQGDGVRARTPEPLESAAL